VLKGIQTKYSEKLSLPLYPSQPLRKVTDRIALNQMALIELSEMSSKELMGNLIFFMVSGAIAWSIRAGEMVTSMRKSLHIWDGAQIQLLLLTGVQIL
jgi:hypothetical protein